MPDFWTGLVGGVSSELERRRTRQEEERKRQQEMETLLTTLGLKEQFEEAGAEPKLQRQIRLEREKARLRQEYPSPSDLYFMKMMGMGGEGKGVIPAKPTETLPEEYEWQLEPIQVKGVTVGQQWTPKATKLSANIVKQQKTIRTARNIIGQLRIMLDEIPAVSGPRARIAGSILRAKAALGTDPKAATYERLRKAVFGQMAKIVSGEMGRLTDQDIKRIEGAIPSLLSTKEERELSFQALEDILRESEETFGLQKSQQEYAPEQESLISRYMQKYPNRSREQIIRAIQKQGLLR